MMITGIMASFGVIFAYIYSAEPFRLKRRGFISPIPIVFGLYLLPILGGWFVFQNNISMGMIIFTIGYMLMNQGYTLVNTAEDFTEDKQEKIITWAHVFGLKMTLQFAFAFSLLGLLCPIGIIIGFVPSPNIIFWIFWGAVVLSVALVSGAAFEVAAVSRSNDLEASAKRHATKLQRWFIMGRYPIILLAAILLL